MSTTRHILQSSLPGDFTTGKYVYHIVQSGTEKYWTGSAWTSTFASGNQYTFGTGTQGGQDTVTFDAATAGVDPSASDLASVDIFAWESGVTPSLGTQVLAYVYIMPATITVVSAGSTATDSAVAADLTLKIWQGRDYPTTSAQCPSWTLEDFTASGLSTVTMNLYPISSYEAGSTIPYTIFQGSNITQVGDDTLLKVPMTDTETAALDGSPVNLPTHVYQVYVTTTGGDKLHVAEQVCRVVLAT